MRYTRYFVLGLCLITILVFVAACGNSSSSPAPVDTTAITGSVFASAVSGGAVVVKDSSGTIIAGPVDTANDGTYTVNVPTAALSNDMSVESSGGSYDDEATGTSTTAGTLAAYVSSESLTKDTVYLDPSSTIVHDLVTKQSKTFGEAQSMFNSAFGYKPDCSIASRNVPSTGGTDDQRMKAFRAGVFSQLTKDMGVTPDKQQEILTAITQDIADDGKLNGSAGTINGAAMPEDINNRFELALMSYLSNTTRNLTGIAADRVGALPFAKVALTNTYRVEYVPGMMAATQGKTSFKLKITKRSDGSAANGLSIKLMPLMHMPTMQHATPVDVVTESSTPGTYNCNAYYLMSSGLGMGFWELQIKIGGMMGETATFYPPVGMPMGDTVRATLKGQADILTSMTGTEKRSYYLFKDGLTSGTTTTFDLFIGAKQSMMSYPAVSLGTVLSSPTGTVTAMTVQASTDSAFTSPVSAVDNTNGHWSLALSGLTTGATNTVYVKLSVNGEDKTTDGNAVSGANAYALFIVTPH